MIQVGRPREPERHIRDAELDLECRIYGYAPVQGDGQLAGRSIYFRARFTNWSFCLAIDPGIDASCLHEGVQPGFFQDGEYRGYALWGDYGHDYEASHMPYTVAERLVRECVAQFLTEFTDTETNDVRHTHLAISFPARSLHFPHRGSR